MIGYSGNYIVDGLVSMMRLGLITPESELPEILAATEEPDLREHDDLDELLAFIDQARAVYRADPGPKKRRPASATTPKSLRDQPRKSRATAN